MSSLAYRVFSFLLSVIFVKANGPPESGDPKKFSVAIFCCAREPLVQTLAAVDAVQIFESDLQTLDERQFALS